MSTISGPTGCQQPRLSPTVVGRWYAGERFTQHQCLGRASSFDIDPSNLIAGAFGLVLPKQHDDWHDLVQRWWIYGEGYLLSLRFRVETRWKDQRTWLSWVPGYGATRRSFWGAWGVLLFQGIWRWPSHRIYQNSFAVRASNIMRSSDMLINLDYQDSVVWHSAEKGFCSCPAGYFRNPRQFHVRGRSSVAVDPGSLHQYSVHTWLEEGKASGGWVGTGGL